MSKARKNNGTRRNYKPVGGTNNLQAFNINNSSYLQDVTEEVFHGDDSVDYGDLLESLEETFNLYGLSDYENPTEARINYHISGSGFKWDNTIHVEVDEIQSKLDFIPDFLNPFVENLERKISDNWKKSSSEYLRKEITHINSYPDKDVSIREMEDFIDNFLND